MDQLTQRAVEDLERVLGDPYTRMNSLYRVLDEDGKDVLFQFREPQQMLWDRMWYLNVILKARQLGFSTMIAMYFLDTCLFNPGTSAGIVDYNLDDAEDKLSKILYAYQNLPAELRELIPLKRESVMSLEWENGSAVEVGVSHRGRTRQLLHVSEYGKIAAERPDRAAEIKTGSFGTVHKGQKIFVESTAEGAGGEFYDMTERAKNAFVKGSKLTELDFQFHFFAWWQHSDYRLNADVAVPQELEEYFSELEAKHGVETDKQQRAWYVKKLEQMNNNRSDMFKEYPATPEEAFYSSLEGAYFKKQMLKMRQSKRLGVVPYDPSLPVHTFWDIGKSDATAIWFYQTDGVRNRFIDYYENSGESVEHYARVLQQKAMPDRAPDMDGIKGREFKYGTHYGPHDLDNQSWALPSGKRVKDVAQEHGIKFKVVPRVMNKTDSIEAARVMLSMSWVDEVCCRRGVQVLDSYTKEWDSQRAVWKKTPRHNWASHGSDALQTGACGVNPRLVPDQSDRYQRRRRKRAQGSAWAA